jgi:hypothetical protein
MLRNRMVGVDWFHVSIQCMCGIHTVLSTNSEYCHVQKNLFFRCLSAIAESDSYFVMPVCPSVCQHERTLLPQEEFS